MIITNDTTEIAIIIPESAKPNKIAKSPVNIESVADSSLIILPLITSRMLIIKLMTGIAMQSGRRDRCMARNSCFIHFPNICKPP